MRFIRKHIKIITIITLTILILSLIVLKIYLKNNNINQKQEVVVTTNDTSLIKEEISTEVEEEKRKVYVDIKGAITNPGVYEVDTTKKVIDVINLAGGLTSEADTSMINLAKQVKDEMVVIIYTKQEVEEARREEPIIKIVEKECVCPEIKNDACLEKNKEDNINNEQTESTNQKINLNKATLEELQTLDGIGESKARAIIAYREEVGTFKSIEELLQVSGIGEALYDKIKENITI